MRAFASLVMSFACLAVCLPLIEAQAPKIVIGLDPNNPKKLTIGLVPKDAVAQKDDKKEEKAPVDKTQDEKKEDPKGEPKVEPKKIVKADPAVVMASPHFPVRIKSLKAETKEVVVVHLDLKLHQAYLTWEQTQNLAVLKDPKLQRNPDFVAKYRSDKMKLLEERFQGQVDTFTAGDALRVRSMFPTPQLDANGKEKKLSATDLAKLKSPPLPGFIADFGQLREGQIVEMYVVKQAPPKKAVDPNPKTPKFIGLDPTLNVPETGKLDVHMLVITSQN